MNFLKFEQFQENFKGEPNFLILNAEDIIAIEQWQLRENFLKIYMRNGECFAVYWSDSWMGLYEWIVMRVKGEIGNDD